MKIANVFKKTVAVSAACLTALTAFTGCSSDAKSSDSEKKRVGVIQIVEHPSLNTIRDSFTERMNELGFTDENTVFDYKSANGEVSTANSIVDGFKSDKCDIIVAIATPTAMAAANVSDEIPVVFSAVTDPIGAGLCDSLESTGRNITGTSDALQVSKILDMALTVTPDIKKLGYLYNSGEDNSVSCLEQVKAYLADKNIELIEAAVTNTSEVQQAAQSLAEKCDAVFSPNDNTIASAMQVAAQVFTDAKVPFYVGADSMVNDNGLATVGIQYTDLGRETADMTASILNGEKQAKDIPVKVFDEDLSIFVNENTLNALGLTLPESIANDPKLVMMGTSSEETAAE